MINSMYSRFRNKLPICPNLESDDKPSTIKLKEKSHPLWILSSDSPDFMCVSHHLC